MFEANHLMLLATIAVATFIQSLTGFGFGLIVVSILTVFNLLPLTATAFLISALSIINSAELAVRNTSHIQKTAARHILYAGLPFIVVGFILLEWLSTSEAGLLKTLLGVFILLATVSLLIKKQKQTHESGALSFFVSGAFAGVLGGLYSTFGPPVVYQIYRQPWHIEQVKATLLCVFSITSLIRLLIIPFGTWPALDTFYVAITAIPVVLIFTKLARKASPFINHNVIRRFSISLLATSGLLLLFQH
ncbi:TSUP family transporter [Alteromonas sp. A079]|uniref:TSUP family transporter n=1 Tax=Alteromonas sp. A079 TaxID=3410268 RepID=UPI003BA24DD2